MDPKTNGICFKPDLSDSEKKEKNEKEKQAGIFLKKNFH